MEGTDEDRRPGRNDGTTSAAVRTLTMEAVQLDKRTLEAIITGVTAKLQDGTSRLARPSQEILAQNPNLAGKHQLEEQEEQERQMMDPAVQ